jgi:glutamate 5-kinase
MRVVIKVGTSLIAPGGQIDANLLRGLVDQFDLARNEYLIVTSGAIAAGMSGLRTIETPMPVPSSSCTVTLSSCI